MTYSTPSLLVPHSESESFAPLQSFRLLCPGPVNVHPEVAAALTSHEFSHREEEMSTLLANLRQNLLRVAGVSAATWAAVVITGSGTAANESVLSSVGAHGRVLVLQNGEFGGRLAQISAYHNETKVVEHGWAEAYDLARIEAEIDAFRPDMVAMVHHETSTGMLNPVEAVGALCKRRGIKLFVDCVSSFAADALDLDGAGVTFASTSSGKALASYPGLSVVFGRHEAFAALAGRKAPCHYLDLYRFYQFAEGRAQTPNTPALPLLLALDRATALVVEAGPAQRVARLRALNDRIRAGAKALGLELLLDDAAARSNVLTSVLLPVGTDFDAFRLGLRAAGFVVYGGKGPYEGRMFQVSTIGAIDDAVIDEFLAAVATVLGAAKKSRSVA